MWALIETEVGDGSVLDVAIFKKQSEALNEALRRAEECEYFRENESARKGFRAQLKENSEYVDCGICTSVVRCSRSLKVK